MLTSLFPTKVRGFQAGAWLLSTLQARLIFYIDAPRSALHLLYPISLFESAVCVPIFYIQYYAVGLASLLVPYSIFICQPVRECRRVFTSEMCFQRVSKGWDRTKSCPSLQSRHAGSTQELILHE